MKLTELKIYIKLRLIKLKKEDYPENPEIDRVDGQLYELRRLRKLMEVSF